MVVGGAWFGGEGSGVVALAPSPAPPAPSALQEDVRRRAARIRLLVLDVDGVLTDGRIVYAEHGDELKFFDVQDGTGLVLWKRAGLHSAIITARKSRLVRQRAKELRVDALAQRCLVKLPAYERLLRRFRVTDEHVCAVGDDLIDLPLLRRAGLAVAVPNAVDAVKGAVHYLTTRSGGRGAVREVVELILQVRGLWEPVTQRYR